MEEFIYEKLVTIEVQFPGPAVIDKGQIFEVDDAARGLVNTATDLGANKLRLEIWLPFAKPHGLTANQSVRFSSAGSSELINMAPVRKGGTATPVRADGGAQKELLIYKESLSSVDFAGMDYARTVFGDTDRHLISLYGDPARRARTTVGATGRFSTSSNVAGQATPSGKQITEGNRSGLGGGSIFTMDGITFGVEVCLDHLCQRLFNYFHGATRVAQGGDPQIEVQLIPSCGMSIEASSVCTVPDGIVFNVDAHHEPMCQDGRGAATTHLSFSKLAPADAAEHFKTAGTSGEEGWISVYVETDRPTPAAVV